VSLANGLGDQPVAVAVLAQVPVLLEDRERDEGKRQPQEERYQKANTQGSWNECLH
jgi:hypothetical protein